MIRRKKRPAFAGLFLCLLPAKTQRKQKTAPGRGLFLYLLRQLAGGDQDDLVGPVIVAVRLLGAAEERTVAGVDVAVGLDGVAVVAVLLHLS